MLFSFMDLRLRGRYSSAASHQEGSEFLNSLVKLQVKIGAPLVSLNLTQNDLTGL